MPSARRRVENVAEPEDEVQSDHTKTLPTELLRIIFYLLASSDPARLVDAPKNSPERAIRRSTRINTGLSTSWRLRGWFVVAHVCARWRALSLGQPALWTVIDINLGPSWVDAFIARSAPLPFVFGTKPKSSDHYNIEEHVVARELTFNKTLCEHASRLVQLDTDRAYALVTQDPFYSTTLPECFFQQYTVLEVLLLRGLRMNLNEQSWASFSAPRLQKLSLHGAQSFPWNLPALSCITHLIVTSSFPTIIEKLRLESFLSNLSTLEALHLEYALNDPFERKLNLTRLRRLGLYDTALRVNSFLQSMDTPSLCAADVSSNGYGRGHVAFIDIMSSTLSHVSTTPFTDLTVVRSLPHPRVHIMLRACQSEDIGTIHPYPDKYLPNPNVPPRLRNPDEVDSRFLALDDVPMGTGHSIIEISGNAGLIGIEATPEPLSFPFLNVQVLHLGGTWNPQVLTEAFSTMTSVKHLRLLDLATYFACTSAIGSSSSGTLFPQLETLSVAYNEAYQGEAWLSPPDSRSELQGDQEFSAYALLNKLVKARTAMGIPLRAIYFHQADAFIAMIREHASSGGVDCSHVVDIIQEDQGMRT